METLEKQAEFKLENGIIFSSRFESGNLANVQAKEPNTVSPYKHSIIFGSEQIPNHPIALGFTFQWRMFLQESQSHSAC